MVEKSTFLRNQPWLHSGWIVRRIPSGNWPQNIAYLLENFTFLRFHIILKLVPQAHLSRQTYARAWLSSTEFKTDLHSVIVRPHTPSRLADMSSPDMLFHVEFTLCLICCLGPSWFISSFGFWSYLPANCYSPSFSSTHCGLIMSMYLSWSSLLKMDHILPLGLDFLCTVGLSCMLPRSQLVA